MSEILDVCFCCLFSIYFDVPAFEVRVFASDFKFGIGVNEN